MAILLVPLRLWPTPTLIASAGTLESPVIDRTRFEQLKSIVGKVTSVAGVPDLKLQWRMGQTADAMGAYSDNANLIASTAALATPEGVFAISLPDSLGPFVQFLFTGLAGNQVDSLLTATLNAEEWL